MTFYLILAFVFSLVINFSIIKLSSRFNFFMDPLSGEKVQSFHKNKTSRAGGLSIYMVSLIGSYFVSNQIFLIVASFLPAFIYGIYEDITGNTPKKVRLAMMGVSTLLCIYLTGIKVDTAGFFDIPLIFQIPLTVIAVLGLSSAINFIDGLNGLAAGVSLLALGCLAVSGTDAQFTIALLLVASSIFGFLSLNFPHGKIFLGDAGAYFLGYFLAMASLCSVSIQGVSPWFPVALLSYPITETLFTMWRRYRRLKKRGINFFDAEKVHLHSLLYLRVFKNNPRASFSILFSFILSIVLAFQFKESHSLSFAVALTQSFIYIVIYRNVVNFKIGKLVSSLSRSIKGQEEKDTILQVKEQNVLSEIQGDVAVLNEKQKVLVGKNTELLEKK